MMAPTLSTASNPTLVEPQCSIRRKRRESLQKVAAAAMSSSRQQNNTTSHSTPPPPPPPSTSPPSFTHTYRQLQQQKQEEAEINNLSPPKKKMSTAVKSFLAAKSFLSSSPPPSPLSQKKEEEVSKKEMSTIAAMKFKAKMEAKRKQMKRKSSVRTSSLTSIQESFKEEHDDDSSTEQDKKHVELDDDTLTATTSSEDSTTSDDSTTGPNLQSYAATFASQISHHTELDEPVTILIEIVGAVKLSSSFTSSQGDEDGTEITERSLQSAPSLIETEELDDDVPSNATNPYVLVKLQTSQHEEEDGHVSSLHERKQEGVVLHKTKTIKNDVNPIFTMATGSLFLFETTLSQLSSNASTSTPSRKKNSKQELHFLLRNKNKSSQLFSSSKSDESLGKVVIPVSSLLDLANEERIECNVRNEESTLMDIVQWDKDIMEGGGGWKYGGGFQGSGGGSGGGGEKEEELERKRRRELLQRYLKMSGGNNGILSLRFRVATAEDVAFVRRLQGKHHSVSAAPTSSNATRSNSIFGGMMGSSAKSKDRPLSASMLLDYEATHEAAPLPTLTTTTHEDRGGIQSKWDIVRHNKEQLQPPKIAKLVTEMEESEIVSNSAMDTIFSIRDTLTSLRPNLGGGVVRVKPYPDPSNAKATTYMTEEQLEMTSRLPSTNWIGAGSGTLGKLYLEVLHCTDLPNTDIDIGDALGNKTDAFVCAIFEDAMVETDVIDDSLSPLWMPWSQRAFVFAMEHPFSTLYLGVFDYDLGITDHEAIGRVAVNLSNLRSGGVYTMKYKLYPSGNITERKSDGFITIRLRMEIKDERQALLAGLKAPPRMHINVTKQKSFAVARYTCHGQHTDEHFELMVTRSYINEILEYKRMLSYAISDSIKSLMFWRGQVKGLPFHSLVFFSVGVHVVEQPRLIPSCAFFCLAWIMMACMGNRRDHPSPWARCHSFSYYLKILLNIPESEERKEKAIRIRAKEGSREAKIYEDAWKARVEDDMDAALKKWEIQMKLAKIGDDDITTETSKSTISDPLNATIGKWGLPWQQRLGRYCRFFRFIKMITTWEESIISFWVTLACLALGFVSLFLPWCFIVQWTSRIIVWVFFGPWMKLVDMWINSDALHPKASKEEREKHKEDNIRDMIASFHEQSKEARLKREEALKLKAIKTMRFGKYITVVPTYKLERHQDRPMPESFAKPASQCRTIASAEMNRKTYSIVPGQNLYGAMIPRTKISSEQARNISLQAKDRLIAILKAQMIPSSIPSGSIVLPAESLEGGNHASALVKITKNKEKLQQQLEQQLLEESEQCDEVEVMFGNLEVTDTNSEEGETSIVAASLSVESPSKHFRSLKVAVMTVSTMAGRQEARQEDVSSRPMIEILDNRETPDNVAPENKERGSKGTESEIQTTKDRCLEITEVKEETEEGSIVIGEDKKERGNMAEDDEQEEGLELVRWESIRDLGNSDDIGEDEKICQYEKRKKRNVRLTSIYQSTNSTYVAFVRPDDD